MSNRGVLIEAFFQISMAPAGGQGNRLCVVISGFHRPYPG